MEPPGDGARDRSECGDDRTHLAAIRPQSALEPHFITTLLAALNIADGMVIGRCKERHQRCGVSFWTLDVVLMLPIDT